MVIICVRDGEVFHTAVGVEARESLHHAPISQGSLHERVGNSMTPPAHASWRSQVLQGMLWVFAGLGVPAVVYVLATTSRGLTRPATLLTLLLTAVLVLVACASRWSFALRALIFIAIAYLGGLLSALYFGYTPGTGLLMLLVVVTCGLFFGKRWLWGGLVVTGASVASVGALHTAGVMATQRPELLDLSQGWNVVRVTIAYMVLAGVIAVSVAYIVHRIEQSLREASEALARYEAERRERTEVEAALQESEETYRHLIENINDVIYAIDAQGVFTYLSPAVEAQSGYKPSELIGRVFSAFLYEEDRQRVLTQFEKLLSGHLEPSEYRMVTKTGEIRWIRSSSRPIYQGDRVVGVRGIYIDITEHRLLEEQRSHAQKVEALGTLAGGIAHEFNNLLASILGFTELATYETPPTAPTHTHLQAVLTAGHRAKELVRQILTFSRQDAPKRQRVALPALIEDSLRFVRASLPATILIESHIAHDAGTVLADPSHLHQISLNLCANAEHAMRQTGGTLAVRVDRVDVETGCAATHTLLQPGSYVRLTVQDTGTGMPPEVVARIFEPFFTTKGVGEGTGMGLAIVHGIVASYGGAITVESTPAVGTTFDVYLPRVAETSETMPAQPEAALPQGSGCILFVDDEQTVSEVGAGLLAQLGYEVVACRSGTAALETFRTTPQQFVAVVTDQTMPHMTGEHLARELRRIRPDIPIVLCTGFSHVMDAEKAHAMGINAFCMKPLTLRDLAHTLQQVLVEPCEEARHTSTPSDAWTPDP